MNQLARYSSKIVLVTMILVTILLGYFYYLFTQESLLDSQRQVSVMFAKSYANSIWPSHAGFIQEAASLTRKELQSSEEIRDIHRDMRMLLRGTNALNITIFDVNGIVAYSTNEKKIGDLQQDTRYLSALSGETLSTLMFHDIYKSNHNELEKRYVVTSYMPIRILDAAPVEGVMAIDLDITSLRNEMHFQKIRAISWLIFIMSLVYLLVWIYYLNYNS